MALVEACFLSWEIACDPDLTYVLPSGCEKSQRDKTNLVVTPQCQRATRVIEPAAALRKRPSKLRSGAAVAIRRDLLRRGAGHDVAAFIAGARTDDDYPVTGRDHTHVRTLH